MKILAKFFGVIYVICFASLAFLIMWGPWTIFSPQYELLVKMFLSMAMIPLLLGLIALIAGQI